MDLLCPNCENALTPSVVGYLCIDCGVIHKYYRATDGTPIGSNIKYQSDLNTSSPSPQSVDSIHNNEQSVNHTGSILYKRKLRTRLKQMVVPELPSVLDDNELESPDRPLLNTIPDSAVFKPALESSENNSNHAKLSTGSPEETPNQNDHSDIVTTKKVGGKKIALISIIVVILLVIVTVIGFQASRPTSNNPPQATVKPSNTVKPADSDNISAEIIDRDNQRKKDLKEISTALEVYKQDTGVYPIGSDIGAVYSLQYTNPPYIKFVSYDPSSTEITKIKYTYSSDGKTFTLKAKLENAQDNEAKEGYYVVTGS